VLWYIVFTSVAEENHPRRGVCSQLIEEQQLNILTEAKMRANKLTLKPSVIALALAFGLLAVPMMADIVTSGTSTTGVAYAADSTDGQGKMQGGKTGSKGHSGQGGPTRDIGSPGDMGSGSGRGGPSADSDGTQGGQGGPSADSDAKGPRYGGEGSKPAAGTSGGRPAWASQELTDIGRMNVARAPGQVLDRSLANAVAELKLPDGTYNVAFLDAALAILKDTAPADQLAALKALLADPTTVRIDSPLSNLAFYKSILTTGEIKDVDGTVVWSVAVADRDLAAAIFIAQAADKTKPVTDATVHAVDVIMSFASEEGSTAPNPDDPSLVWNPDAAQDAAVAVPAEVVRTAVYEVHEGL
jgi:hypothetical protein